MSDYAAPILYAVVIWWFLTGAILWLNHRPRRTHAWSFGATTVALFGALWVIAWSANQESEAGAYAAFTAALIVWGWQEMAFYMGYVAGPRRTAGSATDRGLARFGAAAATNLWHEAAIILGFAAIAWLTAGGPNRMALWTYLVLWGMNLSARLNLFLGVRNLHAEFLPEHLRYLGSFFRRAPMNALFPVAMILATGFLLVLLHPAVTESASAFKRSGHTMMATLMALAILEHGFLMLPLPSAALWGWGLPARRPGADAAP
ncbi:putative photosynthetic complex assembly protein 2 [Methylobacterium sp. ap11]|uniref:putative photosynthetic complex assembly protein PuhE n=1 Tax=Methylobacterium sp. ap11 TaxID=1761799 RepID=UPI0008CEBD3B|nr:putative photosynthetic complex assembly protein PuhE [Methylobacterium sp. ap11]SEP09282.1 putative photosynthetic complex assembly protein 2 [Methylobacterium sp. ap11]